MRNPIVNGADGGAGMDASSPVGEEKRCRETKKTKSASFGRQGKKPGRSVTLDFEMVPASWAGCRQGSRRAVDTAHENTAHAARQGRAEEVNKSGCQIFDLLPSLRTAVASVSGGMSSVVHTVLCIFWPCPVSFSGKPWQCFHLISHMLPPLPPYDGWHWGRAVYEPCQQHCQHRL